MDCTIRQPPTFNKPQHPPTSLLQAPIHVITKYKHPAGSIHTLATTPQSHFLPVSFLVSSPATTLLDRSRSGTALGKLILEPGFVDNKRLLVTHICMLREMHVVVPMTVQQISGRAVVHRRSALSRTVRSSLPNVGFVPRLPTISSVKWVAGQQIACNARRRIRVERGE